MVFWQPSDGEVTQDDLPTVVHLSSEGDFRGATISGTGFEWDEAQEPGCPAQVGLFAHSQACSIRRTTNVELDPIASPEIGTNPCCCSISSRVAALVGVRYHSHAACWMQTMHCRWVDGHQYARVSPLAQFAFVADKAGSYMDLKLDTRTSTSRDGAPDAPVVLTHWRGASGMGQAGAVATCSLVSSVKDAHEGSKDTEQRPD